jgi:hypothetical protein
MGYISYIGYIGYMGCMGYIGSSLFPVEYDSGAW